jgi:hypothetical protein
MKRLLKLLSDFRDTRTVQEALAEDTARERIFRGLAAKLVRQSLASSESVSILGEIEREILAEQSLILPDEINRLPETFFENSTNLGRAYQLLNSSGRDANSWAISKRSDNKSEVVNIAAVTQIFTDDYIANFLVDRCLTIIERAGFTERQIFTLCDPAVGTGHMLIAAIDALSKRGLAPDEIARSIYGRDIDPVAVILTRAALFSQLVRINPRVEPLTLWKEIGKRIRVVPSPYGSLDRSLSLPNDPKLFDIIVTNPPYLGKRKLPMAFRSFLDRDYPEASVDLCAAFMWRCVELVNPDGVLGLVTSDKWIRLDGYNGLRNGAGEFKGLFGELAIDGIYELGSRAFDAASELHDGMKASILIGRRGRPSAGHELSYVNLSEISGRDAKSRGLRSSVTEPDGLLCVAKIRQSELARGGRVLLTAGGLPKRFAELYQQVSDQARVVVGVQTSDDAKFTRYVWQAPDNRAGWRLHSKGGGYSRWAGLNSWIINWENGEENFLGGGLARQRSEKWRDSEGWVYSWFANGNLGLRLKESGVSFGRAAAGGVFSNDNRVAAYLNSRLASAATRSLGGKVQLPEGIVKTIPIPLDLAPISSDLVEWVVKLKKRLAAANPTEASFSPKDILRPKEIILLEALILVCEGVLEHQVETSVGLNQREREELSLRLGPVVGWFRPATPLSEHPALKLADENYRSLLDLISMSEALPIVESREIPRMAELEKLAKLPELENLGGSTWTLPSSGMLETVCRSLRIHPFDALLLVSQLLDLSSALAWELFERYLGVRLIAEIARALGHRWWSDVDLNPDRARLSLPFDAVRDLASDCIGSIECGETMSLELGKWVGDSFVTWQDRVFLKESPFVFQRDGGSILQVSLNRIEEYQVA